MDAEISARKEIKNSYPANLLRQFEKCKSQLNDPKNSYWYWVDCYKTDPDEALEQFRITIKNVYGYSDEDKVIIEQGGKKVFSEDGWTIYHITNYMAAEYCGEGTGWCICGNYPGHENRGKKHFDDYIYDTNPYGFLFIFEDATERKFCAF